MRCSARTPAAMLAEVAYYARMARGLAEYQRSPVSSNPIQAVELQLARRNETFLAMARHVLEQQPGHF